MPLSCQEFRGNFKKFSKQNLGAKKSQGSSPVLHEKRSKDSTKSKPVLRVRKSPVFARKIAKNLGKHIVFRGFCRGQHFYPRNMVYATKF